MKGDFARVSFDPKRHYTRVLQQQGRVQLEADWNEQAAIEQHLLRTLVRDVVGDCWAAGKGFIAQAAADAGNRPLPPKDWTLSAGRYYVDGIICGNDTTCRLSEQPYRPTPDHRGDGGSGFDGSGEDPFALWLDVWERHLSSIEAPSSLESALHGVDTASRAQTVWQLRRLDKDVLRALIDDVVAAVRRRKDHDWSEQDLEAGRGQLLDQASAALVDLGGGGGDGNDAAHRREAACARLRGILMARERMACPRLRAQLGPVDTEEDPCLLAPDARYRGVENQLYRVEIHRGGHPDGEDATRATFKWSRENGSVVFPVASAPVAVRASDPDCADENRFRIGLANLGRDARLGLSVGDRVELVDDAITLAHRVLPLLRVVEVDVEERAVVVAAPDGVSASSFDIDPGRRHPLLRRWDQRPGRDGRGTLDVVEGGEGFELEAGVRVTFAEGGLYATGDYWVIPARVAGNGTLDWPDNAWVPASGLHHFAVLGGSSAGNYHECSCRWIPLCERRAAADGSGPDPGDVRSVLFGIGGEAGTGAKAARAPAAKPARKRAASRKAAGGARPR